jgi:DNA-binding MurR/RpiR family transcriptional regulator
MMPRGALRAVHEHLEDLRNSERKVAQYVLEAPDKVIYQYGDIRMRPLLA